MATQSQINDWVKKSLAEENLKDYVIKISGGSEKGDGNLGDIVFVEVEGTTRENKQAVYHLVVKHAKVDEQFRKAVPVKELFEVEIYLYTTVFPAFREFQREQHVNDIFDCVAKWYYSSLDGDMEVLVLENLRMTGYEQCDRKKPLKLSHSRALLKQLGKFHAVSFAMRDQNRERFIEVASKLQDAQLKLFEDINLGRIYHTSKKFLLEMLEKNGDSKLYEKLSNLLRNGAHEKIIETIKMKESQSVITHGDSWCNNFLFKYEGGNKDIPSKVAIIDWQISTLRSPVFDLSYFFYANCSKNELDSFDELLEFYYNSFATHLTELGSDPEKLFSYSDLKRHWKKYSIFGMVCITSSLRIFIGNMDKAPSFEDIGEGASFADMFKYLTYDGGEPALYDRMKAIVSHYFDFLEKEL